MMPVSELYKAIWSACLTHNVTSLMFRVLAAESEYGDSYSKAPPLCDLEQGTVPLCTSL